LRGLSRALTGMPLISNEGTEPGETPDYQSLQRQSSQLNRDRVEENQRRLAQELLMYSLPLMLFMLIFLLVLVFAGIFIYFRGMWVWFSAADKPCDQPLKWWLLATLMVPLLQFHCNSRPERQALNKRLQALVMPTVICVGVILMTHCKTCAETNPDLYGYAQMYLIYHSVVWVTMMFITFGLVWTVFWLHRHGLLESGPGAARAARPGLINELQTVPYSPELFANEAEESDGAAPECSICQEVFNDSRPLKRTPCEHVFHEDCLGDWLGGFAKSCPLCREDLEEAIGPPPGEP